MEALTTIRIDLIKLFIAFKDLVSIQLKKLNDFRQSIYDMVTLFLVKIPVIGQIVIKYHIALLYFRYLCIKIGEKIERIINLNTIAIIISMICSRLHIAGYMIICCLLFIRLDFALVSVARFYNNNPLVLQRNLPQLSDPNRRGMWSSARKIITEAANNPQVQTVAVAVTGALVWKSLDVYDTQTQKEIAEVDRITESREREHDREAEANRQAEALEAEALRQKESLEAEALRQKEAIEAEALRHKESLEAETLRHKEAIEVEVQEREKDRVEENKRAAFDKMCSPEFTNLSEEQQAQVKQVVQDGKIS